MRSEVARTDLGGARGQKGGFKKAFSAAIIAEIEALVGEGAVDGCDLEAIEIAARREALRVAARAVEGRLNADKSDHAGPTARCSCGKAARYAGRRAKTFESVLGPLTLERAYYTCKSCETGFCPRDRALGLEGVSLSPAVTRMSGLVGAMVSFEEGHELLRELAGVDVDTKQVERTAEALGAEIAEDERAFIEPIESGPVAPTLYAGVDGTGVPMCKSELDGRAGKQPDGSSKTRETKLCAVWSAESRDKEGIPMRDAGSVTYTAAIESAAQHDTDEVPSDFAARVLRETARRRFDQAPRRVLLGDGALWIWNLGDQHLPGAIQIVDLFHAKQHLSELATAIDGPGSDLGKHWATLRHDDLDEGRFDDILDAIRIHASANDEARKNLDYFTRNRDRMRYPYFRAQGLCVSTGVVEAGCKTAVGTRLKRAGMHWTVRGADAILALRCCKLSGRFEDFWERRAQKVA